MQVGSHSKSSLSSAAAERTAASLLPVIRIPVVSLVTGVRLPPALDLSFERDALIARAGDTHGSVAKLRGHTALVAGGLKIMRHLDRDHG